MREVGTVGKIFYCRSEDSGFKARHGRFYFLSPLENGRLSRLIKYSQSHIIGLFMVIYGYLWLVRVKVWVRVTFVS